jgi:TetR/AcrR family transcriptional regulator, cholesterol catabolism regulator
MSEATVQRKDEVLAAAERLFAERGYEATSVRDIAETLSIKPGSLYAHIETKEDLLWDILTEAADRFFAAIRPIVESDLVVIEKIRRTINAHVKVITSSARSAAIYMTEWRHLSEPRRTKFAAKRDEYEELIRGLVREGIRAGELGDVDEKFASLLILSSMNWIFQWYRPDGPMTPDEIARKLTEMLLNGLRRAAG